MRNLSLIYHKHQKLPINHATHSLVDHNSKEYSYVISSTHINKINSDIKTCEPIYTLDEATSNIVAIEHLSLNDELCLATSDGEVVVLNLQSLQTESVAFCDGGIECMSWSPDQEVVLFLTKTGVLVVMDTAYTSIYECDLKDSDFGDQAFVNVGWGHKETQFHGTEGKAAAKQKPDELLEPIDVHKLDRTASIVWRGDSEFFAISFVGETVGRMFKVFDKEGKLQFTSEKCVGLEAAICWRPSGTWIAIPQRLPNKYVIALFEKNGLKHREIVLPIKASNERIERLDWSSDSDILAITTFNESDQKSAIYLYTMGNYHWYQKQTLLFDSKITSIFWDPRYTEGKQLHVLLDNLDYSIFRWKYTVCHSKGHCSRNAAMVAVIDGAKMLITNFRGAVIPPPMCSFTLETLNPINYSDFLTNPSEADDPNTFFIVDTNNIFTILQPTFVNGLLKDVEVAKKFEFEKDVANGSIPLSFNHWIWLSIDTIAVTQTDSNDGSTFLYCNLIDGRIKIIDSIRVDGCITSLVSANSTELFIHLANGSVHRANLKNFKIILTKGTISYSDIVDDVHVYRDDNDTQRTFALKQKQWLHLDDKQVATEVTSMFLTEKYLLFTTLDRLKFVRLSDGQIVNERRMERGGRLVTVVPHDSRTVLQMPRGNLEVIQPRVLSLCIIGELLDISDYNTAFDLMRKQRINLNLLIDHNPAKLLQEVDIFIQAIDNANWLNLFLSDLENIDVTATMYNSNYTKALMTQDQRKSLLGASKVNTVCSKVCTTIRSQNKADTLLLPILTTHVKQKNLDLALGLVWQIKQSEIANGEVTLPTSAVSAQDALKYLLYLVDVNELYNVALGMYDFGLVLFVATKSQKDPKEYLPFLNELQKIDDLSYRSYKIDLYLKRYTKALEHVARCGEARLPEALELIGKEALYTTAMRLYDDKTCYKAVVYAFAGHLREKGKFRDASLMYERSGDIQQAILSARHILDWQKCVTLARSMGQTDEEISQLVSSLIPSLIENGNNESAAELIIRHQGNYEAAIPLLCDGKLYLKALYEAKMNAEHLIATIIRPHLESYAVILTELLQADADQFTAYKLRLATVRREKLERKLNQFHDEDVGDECDMFSDTSSMNSSRFSTSSRGTGKTHRSSKNRRKHERKLLSLKEGNPFEDIALVDALHTLALKSYDQQQPVRALGKALIEQRLDSLGVCLQRVLAALLRLVRESLDEIWIPEMVVSGTVSGEQGNVDYALIQEEHHYSMIKPYQRFKPVLKAIDWEFDILE